MTTKRLYCERPDRTCPKLKCGHPLPCPHHTVTMTPLWVYSPQPLPAETLDRLEDIARTVYDDD